MPCHKKPVKEINQGRLLKKSLGAIDLHFHGAFGIDLMKADRSQCHELSRLLWKNGIAGFCPTTLSSPKRELLTAVQRLGRWIRSFSTQGAIPLGIHLEGPWINPEKSGAHPKEFLRSFSFSELEALWKASYKTLKIITLAPELLTLHQKKLLYHWSKKRQVLLFVGHSQVSEAGAKAAIDLGFSGITHAWNALAFHHRSPGALGAAVGNKDVSIEIIIDQTHVSPTLIHWLTKLHPLQRICFISDCAPAAQTPPHTVHSFGNLKTCFSDGACKLMSGGLAGGGVLLPQAFIQLLQTQAHQLKTPLPQLLNTLLPCLTHAPLHAIGINSNKDARLRNRQIHWILKGHKAEIRVDDPKSSS